MSKCLIYFKDIQTCWMNSQSFSLRLCHTYVLQLMDGEVGLTPCVSIGKHRADSAANDVSSESMSASTRSQPSPTL